MIEHQQIAKARYTVATAGGPGAVGIIQVFGEGTAGIVERLTGMRLDGRCRLVSFGGIDEGLVVGLGDEWCELMPHGGKRVVELVCARLRELGARSEVEVDARVLYPEAESELEAEMLGTMGRAGSRAAVERLMAQPGAWREAIEGKRIDAGKILRASDAMDWLVKPATVVLMGRANVGKSTLSNLVSGRAGSITADLPGTTRDWVASLAALPMGIGEVAVRWFDTPGIRESEDVIEQRAIELARGVIERADVLLVMRDPGSEWPDMGRLRRRADVWIGNKADTVGFDAEKFGGGVEVVMTDALSGKGLEELAGAIGGVLGLGELEEGELWAFCAELRRLVGAGDMDALAGYAGVR